MSMIVYEYSDADEQTHHAYMLPVLQGVIDRHAFTQKRAFELGCGNGFVANVLSRQGFAVTGIDPSASGIAIAQKQYPGIAFRLGNSDEPLAETYGRFPLVYSFETIAHVVDTGRFARCVHALLQDGGVAVISTPFHGFWKNLALSLSNTWDQHWHTLWEGRYLSFFSEPTFRQLWTDAGFKSVTIVRVGRTQALAKAMIAVLQKA